MLLHAGDVTYDFSSHQGSVLTIAGNNDATYVASGGNPGGFLALTYAQNSQYAAVVFPNIDAGKVVMGFTFSCDLRVGNPYGDRAADGFSISFARDGDPVLANPAADAGFAGNCCAETGTKTGIAVSFDTWSGNTFPSDPADTSDIEGIIVRVDNVTVKKVALPTRNGAADDITSLQTGPRDGAYWDGGGDPRAEGAWKGLAWRPLAISLTTDGKLTVSWKGNKVLDGFQTTYFPSAGQIVFAGRTGGANENTHVDNIRLTTIAQAVTAVPGAAPNFKAASVGAQRVVLTWDPATVAGDGNAKVAYEIERDGVVLAPMLTTTTYTDPGVSPGKAYTYKVRGKNIAGLTGPETSTQVTTAALVDGYAFLRAEQWTGIGATSIENGLSDTHYQSDPADRVRFVNGFSFGETSNFGDTWGDNHFVRISGVLTAPKSGSFRFFVRSDDTSALYVNTSAAIPDPATSTAVAVETGCCTPFLEPGDESVSQPIALVAGKQYGITFVVKEGGGGDWGQVAMREEGNPTPPNQLEPIRGAILTGKVDAVGASVEITTAPASVTVAANDPVTFRAAATGVSPYGADYGNKVVYTWLKNGVPFGGNGESVTIPVVPKSDNGARIAVMASVAGASATSSEAILTVNDDLAAPTVLRILGNDTFDGITFTFNEPVDDSALVAANYTIKGLTLSNPVRVDDRTIKFTTSKQEANKAYSVAITGVKDNSGLASAFVGTFNSYIFMKGVARFNIYNNQTGGFDTFGSAGAPTETRILNEYFTGTGLFENYFGQIKGVFTPTKSGDYVFWLSSDDHGELYLSTDANPANKKRIAEEPSWSDPKYWRTDGGANSGTRGDEGALANRSDQYGSTEWPTGSKITLTAGQQYYLEVLYKEGGGGDHGAATFAMAGEGLPPNGSTALTGDVIGWFVDPSLLPPVIAKAPGSVTFNAGERLTMSVEAVSALPLTYQWYQNKNRIEGANSATYTLPRAGVGNVGDYYVEISNGNGKVSTYPDNGARAIMKGAFVIEAEDYNYGGGKSVAEASQMPLRSDLYRGKDGLKGIDFNIIENNTDSGCCGNSLRQGWSNNGSIAAAEPGANVDVVADGNAERPDFTLTQNYKIGWGDSGEWYNYTRDFPPGTYSAVLGFSWDGLGWISEKYTLDLVTSDPSKGDQVLTRLAEASVFQTGGWSSNDHIPFLTPGGNSVATFTLGAKSTLRLTIPGGDLDYLLFYRLEDTSKDTDSDGLSDSYEKGIGRYEFVPGSFTWDEAMVDAQAKGGHLVTITSEAEWLSISNILGSQLRGRMTWMGGHDREVNDQWQWVTGEPFAYRRWHPYEPNGSGNVMLMGWDSPEELLWDDYGNGESRLPYILERGYYTDPLVKDTDGDGVSDGDEIARGTSPVDAKPKPVVVSWPEGVVLQTGSSTQFEVIAQGEGLQYRWYRNGRLIDPIREGRLLINSVSFADEGFYQVEVFNMGGAVLSPIWKLSVITSDPPVVSPIQLTGWNKDLIYENKPNPQALGFDGLNSGWSFFEEGFEGHIDGFPSSKVAWSSLFKGVQFAFQSYESNNALKLDAENLTGDLTLVAPATFTELHILGASGSGTGPGLLEIEFTDGSISQPIPWLALDWWANGVGGWTPERDKVSLVGLDGVGRNLGANTYQGAPYTFGLYETVINLEKLGYHTKAIRNLKFTKAPAAEVSSVFAVSGLPAGGTALIDTRALRIGTQTYGTLYPSQNAKVQLIVAPNKVGGITCKWSKDGQALTNNATLTGSGSFVLTIAAASPAYSGTYTAEISDGFNKVTSDPIVVDANRIIVPSPFVENSGAWSVAPGGSFEGGLAAPVLTWSASGGVVFSNSPEAIRGTNAALVTVNSNTSDLSLTGGAVALMDNVEYVLSAFVKITQVTPGGRPYLDLNDTAGQPSLTIPLETKDWQFVSVIFKLPMTASVKPRFVFGEGVTQGTYVWIDDLSITRRDAFSAPLPGAAKRVLPSGYVGGQPTTIQILSNPPNGTSTYSIMETIPQSWSLISASEGSFYDPAARTIKFGPYPDNAKRDLFYTVIPPEKEVSTVKFIGQILLGSSASPIGGDSVLDVVLPPKISIPLQTPAILEGKRIELAAQVSGKGPFEYQWFKNGVAIANAKNSSVLISLSAGGKDTGRYSVTVQNLAGKVETSVDISVVEFPRIVLAPQPLDVIQGQPLAIQAQVGGSEPLTYVWRQGSKVRSEFKGSSVMIDSAQTTDAGVWSLEVSNPAGVVTTLGALVKVFVPPQITVSTPSVEVLLGEPFEIKSTITGTLPIVIEWRKDGQLIAGVGTNVFRRNAAALEDAGLYTLTARNIASQVSSLPIEVRVKAAFVSRTLPVGYWPGGNVVVRLKSHPVPGTQFYEITDQIPEGWKLSAPGTGGTASADGKSISFGPILGEQPQEWTYTVETPTSVTNQVVNWSGKLIADGMETEIQGDSKLGRGFYHPADNLPRDGRISISEITKYAAAWKKGQGWSEGPTPIPVGYVTRAGALWKQGELYLFDPEMGLAPRWWLTPSGAVKRNAVSPNLAPRVRRSMETRPDGTSRVKISMEPGQGAAVQALEERLPADSQLITKDSEAEFVGGVLRWGPYFDDQSRVLEYEFKTGGTQETATGVAAVDGWLLQVVPQDAVSAPAPRLKLDGSILWLEGSGANPHRLQQSQDLNRWQTLDIVPAADQPVGVILPEQPSSQAVFYRITPTSE